MASITFINEKKRRYEEAFESAQQGNFEAIPILMRMKHYDTWKKIRMDHMEATRKQLPMTRGIWLIGSTIEVDQLLRANFSFFHQKTRNDWELYSNERIVVTSPVESRLNMEQLEMLYTLSAPQPFPITMGKQEIKIFPAVVIFPSNSSIADTNLSWSNLAQIGKNITSYRLPEQRDEFCQHIHMKLLEENLTWPKSG